MKIVILVVYAVILMGIALFSARQVRSAGDFMLGGRNVGAWMSAFAYGTSYFSAVIFIGYAGQFGWNFGLASTWVGIGNAIIGSLLPWLILGKRTRSMTQKLNAATMPQLFGIRYQSRGLRLASAILTFVFLVPYSASVYQGLSYLFETLFGIPFIVCMIAMVVLTAIYLLAGGYLATALSDFFQGIIMLIGIVIVVACVLNHEAVGGLSGVVKLSAIDPKLVSPWGAQGWWPTLSVVLLTSLGTWGLPQMTHKFYAIRDEKAIMRGTIISTIFALIVAGGCYFIGGFARLFQADPTVLPLDATTGTGNTALLVPQMLQLALPEAMIGIVLVLVLAASMSTLSSLALSAASVVGIDLIGPAMGLHDHDKRMKPLLQILCLIFIVASFVLALDRNALITSMMGLSWGALSGAFIGPFLLGLYWKRTGRAAAWCGMITGLAVSIIISCFTTQGTIVAGVFAMFASLIVTTLATLIFPAKENVAV